MKAIIFIDAGVILDHGGGPAVRSVGGAMGPDAGAAMQFRHSGSADAVNDLAARLAAPLVVHDPWGLPDPVKALRASGITAPFYDPPRVDMRPLYHLHDGRPPEFGGDWGGAELAPVTISFAPKAPDLSPLSRWMRANGGGAMPVLITGEGVVGDVPGLIRVSIVAPAALRTADVDTVVAMVERGR